MDGKFIQQKVLSLGVGVAFAIVVGFVTPVNNFVISIFDGVEFIIYQISFYIILLLIFFKIINNVSILKSFFLGALLGYFTGLLSYFITVLSMPHGVDHIFSIFGHLERDGSYSFLFFPILMFSWLMGCIVATISTLTFASLTKLTKRVRIKIT